MTRRHYSQLCTVTIPDKYEARQLRILDFGSSSPHGYRYRAELWVHQHGEWSLSDWGPIKGGLRKIKRTVAKTVKNHPGATAVWSHEHDNSNR